MKSFVRLEEHVAAADIARRSNIVIGKAGARDLTGNLYVPARIGEPRSAVVVVHGGGWRKGSAKGVHGFAEFLSRTGVVCLCPDYRLSGEAHWPAQIEDVKCSIRFLRAHAGEFEIDPTRIGILGDSAGGHLALMAGVEAAFEGNGGFNEHLSEVSAIGALYGPVRVKEQRADGTPLGLMAPNSTAAEFAAAGPIHYELGQFPPCLLIHGADDQPVPLAGTIEFYTKLKAFNRTVELHVFAGEGHAFDRRSSVREGMVDVYDPSSISGPTVVGLIARFFHKFL